MRDIALAGPAGVGKDTVAQVLVEQHGYVRVAFADALKDVLEHANPLIGNNRLCDFVYGLGWDAAKRNPEVRRLLQEFGMAMRAQDENIWVQLLDRRVSKIDADTPVVVTDMRLPSELDWAKRVGMMTFFLERDGVNTGEGWRGHVSENSLYELWPAFDDVIAGSWTPQQAVDIIATRMSQSTMPHAYDMRVR